MLTPEQIERRRLGLGSSDMPRVVGVSPHGGPIDVYLDKLGLSEHEETIETWCGNELEEAIAHLYEERADIGLTQGQTLVHPRHAWALATPDRWRDDAGGLVEIKLVGAGLLHLWRLGVQLADGHWTGLPAHVEIQVQWQLEVCDVERAEVAALIGGTDFRIYPVERDRELGADLLALGADFWIHHILAREPPPMSGEDARRLAQLRYPMSMGDMLEATPEAEHLRDRILRLKRHQKRVEDLRAHLEARAMEFVGNADGIQGCFTWKRAGKAETWKAAARERWFEGARAGWEHIEATIGEDDLAWESLAGAGQRAPTALIRDQGAPRRRFLTKEPKNGGRR